jgi:hypothetical protein
MRDLLGMVINKIQELKLKHSNRTEIFMRIRIQYDHLQSLLLGLESELKYSLTEGNELIDEDTKNEIDIILKNLNINRALHGIPSVLQNRELHELFDEPDEALCSSATSSNGI